MGVLSSMAMAGLAMKSSRKSSQSGGSSHREIESSPNGALHGLV